MKGLQLSSLPYRRTHKICPVCLCAYLYSFFTLIFIMLKSFEVLEKES